MKKITSIRMEEDTARMLKIAAIIAGENAGDFLTALLENWARENNYKFQLRTEKIASQK